MSRDSRGTVTLRFSDDPDGSLYVDFYDVTEEERQQVVRALDTLYRSMGGSGLEQVHESRENVFGDNNESEIPVAHFLALIEQYLARTKEGGS